MAWHCTLPLATRIFHASTGLIMLIATSVSYGITRPNFGKGILRFDKVQLSVEIARLPAERAFGLMFQKKLAPNSGMLFLSDQVEIQNFWMRNTFIPLSLGFFDQDQRLIETCDLNPVVSEMDQNPDRYESKKPAKYVLEVNKGWFTKNGISIGRKFQLSESVSSKSSGPGKK